jgi:hypothetical protein
VLARRISFLVTGQSDAQAVANKVHPGQKPGYDT